MIEEFFFAFGDGIPTEVGDMTDEGDPIVSNGEGEETSNVPLVTFVESSKQ